MSVVVFGSINMDLVARTPRLPAAGETLIGRTFFTAPGGKGANQAVACARLGATTSMIGLVGDDVFGPQLVASLQGYGVNTAGVRAVAGQPSGVAVIAVGDSAENNIIVIPGANAAFDPDDLTRLDGALAGASVLLLQLEIPLPMVLEAARLAHRRGVRVILDPAPACPLPPELYALVAVLTPNETEAETLTGVSLTGNDEAASERTNVARAAAALAERGAAAVIIKRAGRGVYLYEQGRGEFRPAFPVTPVDTVAAGDAFNGALAAALDEGLPLGESVRWGAAAGALSVTRAGAQPSMPSRTEVLALLGRG
jgi:ribokinase